MTRRLVLAAVLAASGPAAAQGQAPVSALLDADYLLSVPRIVDPDLFRGEGAVLGAVREITIPDLSLTESDQIFVPQPLRGSVLALGDLVQLYRIERRIHDPVTGERLGRLFVPTGVGRVDSLAGAVVRLRVVHAFEPIRLGDFARPVSAADTGAAHAGNGVAGGYVVALQEEKAIAAPYDRLFLRAPVPLAPGTVVAIHRSGGISGGRRLPEIELGRALVVRSEGYLAVGVLYEVYRSDLAPGDAFRP